MVELKSRLSDLVVTQGFAAGDDVAIRVAIESTLMNGRPMVIASQTERQKTGERVAIAFDGSAAAAHSVTAAMPFVTKARSVTLIKVAEELKRTAELDSLADYLAMRGVESTKVLVDPAGRSISETLFSAVEKAECDLLVMGGYGHHRLREVVFGGVTRDVLSSHLSFSVLMAH
jgi:nucleotide-binding universal stress UspA family protein